MKKHVIILFFTLLLLALPAFASADEAIPLPVMPGEELGDYVPVTTELEGIAVAAVIAQPLKDMLDAARNEGLSVYLAAGYRDRELRHYVYRRAIFLGMSPEKAGRTVGLPENSDYGTGLSVDITDVYHEQKDVSLADTETLKWLAAHCAEYGFILRYPEGKAYVTGMDYLPWHFRYVGSAAEEIMRRNITLEEYLAQ